MTPTSKSDRCYLRVLLSTPILLEQKKRISQKQMAPDLAKFPHSQAPYFWNKIRMSGTNLDLTPLRLVVSRSSAHGGSIISKNNCKCSSGSDSNRLERGITLRSPQRTSSWRPSSSNLHMGDPHDFYLGDIYARISRPFDCFLATQAEQEWVSFHVLWLLILHIRWCFDIADKL